MKLHARPVHARQQPKLTIMSCFSVVVILLFICIGREAQSAQMCGCEYRYDVLMEFYNATNGQGWTNNAGWGTTNDCTVSWYGATCDSYDVATLNLYNNKLQGTLPESLSQLYRLTSISLGYNSLLGTLPPSWRNLTKLFTVYLPGNRLNGTLPTDWASMEQLSYLNLQSNSLTGTLPDTWASMTSLTSLYLDYNALNGTLSSPITQMDSLQYFSVSSNKFTGSIPDAWGSMISSISVSYNNLMHGTLPSLRQFLTLSSFSAASCGLEETLPDADIFPPTLQTLDLSSNSLIGTIPPTWVSLSIRNLFLGSNQLNGTLPDFLGHMPNLQQLQLYGNSFSGGLPPAWGNGMRNLTYLYIGNTALNGSLPREWGSMPSIQTMYLWSNRLTGTLPSSWSNLKTLTQLFLNNNDLIGSLPSSWGNLRALTSLYLYGNSLSGSLPSSWRNMTNIQTVYLSSNSFIGTLPASWGYLTSLTQLYMSSNSLSGSIPSSWASLTSLQYVDLSYNALDGTLPDFMANMTGLRSLSLSSNRFSGSLPRLWGQLQNLDYVYVSNNILSGTFPATWSSMKSLQYLYVFSNCFYGYFPDAQMEALPLNTSGYVGICNTRLKSSRFGCSSDWPNGCRYSSPTASASPATSVTMMLLPLPSTTRSSYGSASQSRRAVTASTFSFATSRSQTNMLLSASATFSPTSSTKRTLSITVTTPCARKFSLVPASSVHLNVTDLQVLNCSGAASCDVSSLYENTTTNATSLPTDDNRRTKQSVSTNVEFRVINFPILSNASLAVHLCMPQRWYLRAPSNIFKTIITTFPSTSTIDTLTTCVTVVTNISQQTLSVGSTTTNISLQALCNGGGILPVPVSILIYWPLPPSDSPTIVSTATQGITSGSAILGAFGGAASGASSTAMLVILTCNSVPPINTVTYFVSVFFELGLATVALGNVGIIVVVLMTQLLVVEIMQRRTHDNYKNVTAAGVPALVEKYISALAMCRFPALSIQVMGFLLPGSLLGAVGVMLREPTVTNVALSTTAILCIFTAFAGQVAVQRLVALPQASFVLYRLPYCAGTGVEKRFLFPAGRWEPAQVSQAFGSLFAPMIPGHSQLLIVEMMLACVLGIVSGAFIGGICDSPLLLIVAVLHFSYCAFLGIALPHRLPTDRVFAPIIHLLTGVICVLRYQHPWDGENAVPLQQGLSGVQVASSICTLYYHFFREGPLRAGDDVCLSDTKCLQEEDTFAAQEELLPLQEHLTFDEKDVVLAFADVAGFWDNNGNALSQSENIADDSVIVLHEVVSTDVMSSRPIGKGAAPLSLFDAYCEASNSGGENYFLCNNSS